MIQFLVIPKSLDWFVALFNPPLSRRLATFAIQQYVVFLKPPLGRRLTTSTRKKLWTSLNQLLRALQISRRH